MEKNVVMIDLARYNELIKAQERLEVLKSIVEVSDCEFGYNKDTSKLIDGLLDIDREEM